jgi:probable rRNA maturation factor
MTPKHIILVSIDDAFADAVDGGRLESLARRALNAEEAPPCELSVTVTDDETVRALNREYAGEDAVTDVLSFSQREGEALVAPLGATPALGEVVIAYPQAVRQAKGGVDLEVDWLLVHGVLHLLGYDHAEPEEARRMREREESLVNG